MKNKYIIRIAVLLLLLCNFSLSAQVDTKGTDFWLAFGLNSYITSMEVDLQIRIVGSDQPATGTIYFTNMNDSVTFNVGAGQVFTHSLTLAQRADVYIQTMGISNRRDRKSVV